MFLSFHSTLINVIASPKLFLYDIGIVKTWVVYPRLWDNSCS